MTSDASPVTSTTPHPAETAQDRSPAAEGAVSAGRLVGVDLARGLAVFGMYAVHVGPDATVGGPVGFLMELASGRSSTLFAVLAGFTLVLITGRPVPRTGRAGRQAVGRIVLRALVLMALGYALTALDTDVNVILAYYGLLFLIVLPLYRLDAARLAAIAGAGALILPQVLYSIHRAVDDGSWGDAVIAHDPLARLTGSDGFLELLFMGDYPVLTWLPFMVAGMALARLDLGRALTRARLAWSGAGLTVVGYGGSWLALHLVPHALSTIAATGEGSASAAWWSDTAGEPLDSHPWQWLLVAAPHSQTTFSILGNTGVALAVVAATMTLAARLPRAARLATPVASVGMISLTAYTLQIVALWLLGPAVDSFSPLALLLAFVGAAMAVAVLITRLFRRGPLEYLLHVATRPARLVP
ncbi:DUF418 domain-containing protein [Streptomyces minutiscleroticus]|uniref:DUF418 domain-containing protein n=1 Tax=Streptomyces minutiscleroticus TaxID=68238 RepID=UPI00167E01E9|nr:DUF418 domain-containing protein [Streptomyces minutiscleroticus]